MREFLVALNASFTSIIEKGLRGQLNLPQQFQLIGQAQPGREVVGYQYTPFLPWDTNIPENCKIVDTMIPKIITLKPCPITKAGVTKGRTSICLEGSQFSSRQTVFVSLPVHTIFSGCDFLKTIFLVSR